MIRVLTLIVLLAFAVSSTVSGPGMAGSVGSSGMQGHVAAQTDHASLHQGHPDKPADTKHAAKHVGCGIAGHTCAGFVVPGLVVAGSLLVENRAWAVPGNRRPAGLVHEATIPPPRV
jgi:hypothetical protein